MLAPPSTCCTLAGHAWQIPSAFSNENLKEWIYTNFFWRLWVNNSKIINKIMQTSLLDSWRGEMTISVHYDYQISSIPCIWCRSIQKMQDWHCLVKGWLRSVTLADRHHFKLLEIWCTYRIATLFPPKYTFLILRLSQSKDFIGRKLTRNCSFQRSHQEFFYCSLKASLLHESVL